MLPARWGTRDANGQILAVYNRSYLDVVENEPADPEWPEIDWLPEGADYMTLFHTAEYHLYGSDRLGIHRYEDTIAANVFSVGEGDGAYNKNGNFADSTHLTPTYPIPYIASPSDGTWFYTFTRGRKRYELTNHLGNVLETVSDRKLQVEGSGGKVKWFTADVWAMSDYYAFGMLMPGRNMRRGDYRFGFQGQEMDDEVYGQGNAVSYKYRVHDPRIGRFLSIDPLTLKYPFYSPYSFSGNRVIDATELEGLEPSFIGAESALKARDFAIATALDIKDVSVAAINWALTFGSGIKSAFVDDEVIVPQIGRPSFVFGNGNDAYNAVRGDAETIGHAIVAEAAGIAVGVVVPSVVFKQADDVVKKSTSSTVKYIPCGCFSDSTLIFTDEGLKPINEIQIGDFVWAYNDSTKEVKLKQVIHTFSYVRQQIYQIYIDNTVLEATDDHPFFIEGEWVKVKDIQIGDTLYLYQKEEIVVDSITIIPGETTVYNFTVEDFHTYFVSQKRILVHNGSPCKLNYADELEAIELHSDYAGTNLIPNYKSLRKSTTIEDGKINFEGKKANTPYAFVISNDGTLHIGDFEQGMHFQLAGGSNTVKGAGVITFDKQGSIISVNNSSGHYSVGNSKSHNTEVVDILNANGVIRDEDILRADKGVNF
jgi:RHS repeat-associated protein